ncbi:TPA: lysozyme family protein, partial [Streptococcus pyogenes]
SKQKAVESPQTGSKVFKPQPSTFSQSEPPVQVKSKQKAVESPQTGSKVFKPQPSTFSQPEPPVQVRDKQKAVKSPQTGSKVFKFNKKDLELKNNKLTSTKKFKKEKGAFLKNKPFSQKYKKLTSTSKYLTTATLKKSIKGYSDELKRNEEGVKVAISGFTVSYNTFKKICKNIKSKKEYEPNFRLPNSSKKINLEKLKKTENKKLFKPKNKETFVNKLKSSTTIVQKSIKKTSASYVKELEQGDSDGVKVALKSIKEISATSKKLQKGSTKISEKASKIKKQSSKISTDFLKKDPKKLQKEHIKKLHKQQKKQLLRKNIVANQKAKNKLKREGKKFTFKNLQLLVSNAVEAFKAKIVAGIGSLLVPTIPAFLVILTLLIGGLFIGGALSKLQEPQRVSIGAKNLSPEVEKWRPLVEKIAGDYGMSDYVNLILAIIQVETGGTGTRDIMQSSESAGHEVNYFKTEEESIRQGVKHLRNIVAILASYRKNYEGNYKLIAQSYNYGSAFAKYVGNRGGDYDLQVSEDYSRTVVAPSLGNVAGITYPYINEVSVRLGKPYLYLNGGNFMYGEKISEYVGAGGSDPTTIVAPVLGKYVGNGQCYGFTSYYAQAIGGPGLGAGVGPITDTTGVSTAPAYNIGIAYNWAKYGWQVVLNPTYADLRAGDIINWSPGGYFDGTWGHTGVIKEVLGNGAYTTYEQNAGKGQIVAEYSRHISNGHIASIIHPPK